MTEEKKREINWTPVAIGGAILGGLFLVWKIIGTLAGGNPANNEQARLIMTDWQQEFDQVKSLTESMYAGGRTPTDQETAALSSILNQMKLKEWTIYELSKSVWSELGDMAMNIAKAWGIIIGVTVPGYIAIKLVKNWTNKNRPPPNYPCPAGDFVGATKGALDYHIKTVHPINTANLTLAQQAFSQASSWAQNAVAVESGLYDKTFIEWTSLSTAEIRAIVVAIAIIVAAALVGPEILPAAGLVLA